jgi:UDP-glucose 4-epimerase
VSFLPNQNRNKPAVMITGGAGFIGSHLTRRLVRSGYRVTVFDNMSRGRIGNLQDCIGEVSVFEADIGNYPVLLRAMKGTQTLFHLAAQSNVIRASSDIDGCIADNITGTANVVKAARASGVRRLIFSSSREVYGEATEIPIAETAPLRPKNPYGMSKVAGEMCCQIARSEGLETTILRIANAYGAGDHDRVIPNFVNNALCGLPLKVYGGNQVLDFVRVEFVIEALMKVGLGPYVPGPLNIASGKGTTVLKLAERILGLVRSRSKIEILPGREIETSRFVASTSAAEAALDMPPESDSLASLPQLIASMNHAQAGMGKT